MNFMGLERYIEQSSIAPADSELSQKEWLRFSDVITFLKISTQEMLPVYVSSSGIYIYSVFVPINKLTEDYVDDLLGWNFSPSSGWGYGTISPGQGRESEPVLYHPLDDTHSRIFDNCDPVFFLRFFEGHSPKKSYIEINQKLSHIIDVHWSPVRNAYCRIDQNGDFEDIVKIQDNEKGFICAIQRSALDFYMFITNTVLVRVFDFNRCLKEWPLSWNNRSEEILKDEKSELYAKRVLIKESLKNLDAGFLRGFQIIRNQEPREKLMKILRLETIEPKRYETFIIWDWKNKQIKEWSCDPEKLGNYFVESDLPFFTSPAFFRPEVLLKYKQDPEKYTVGQRRIHCRGAWSLMTYDINKAGQVHTYVGYLGYLPYQEQLYWKSFNEKPKGGISNRAFTTDFMGEWYTESDPLEDLKECLRKFPQAIHHAKKADIWTAKSPNIENVLHKMQYVVTESSKEWSDQILELSKVIIDGLEKSNIRCVAKALGCDDPEKGSIKLLCACLRARGIDEDVVTQVCDPLISLQKVRSQCSAHGGGQIPQTNLKDDYRRRVSEINQAMHTLAELINEGVLNI